MTTYKVPKLDPTTGLVEPTQLPAPYTDEQAQDATAAMIAAGTQTGISVAYNDTANSLSFTATGSYTDEQAQDAVAAMLAAGTQTGITATYNDSANSLSLSVASSGGTGGTSIIYAGDHGTLDPTGATDNSAILRACYTAALASLASGAAATRIVFPAGTFKMASTDTGGTGTPALVLRSSSFGHTGRVTIEGAGKAATTFKMTTTAATLLGYRLSDAGTFGNLTLRGFNVDRGNITGVGRTSALLALSGQYLTIADILIEQVDVLNMGTAGASQVTIGASIGSNTAIWGDTTQRTVTGIRVRDCSFYGGNYGLLMQGYSTAQGTVAQLDSTIIAGGINANVLFDEIYIERFKWDSGANFATATAGDSAGVMIGSGGVLGKVRLTDVSVKGSCDVGYEMSTAYDCIFTRCTSEDALNTHFYYRPQGGLPNVNAATGASAVPYNRSHYMLIDCSAYNRKLADSTVGPAPSSGGSMTYGFYLHAKDFGQPAGNVVIRNFSFLADGPNALNATGSLARITGGFHSVDIDGCTLAATNFNVSQTFGMTTRGLSTNMRNGRGNIRLRNFKFVAQGQHTGGASFTLNALNLDALSDYTVDIDGVHSRVNVASTTTAQYSEINFASNNNNDSETFKSAQTLIMGWRNDLVTASQSLADFAVASNTLSLTSPGTTEYRLTQVCDESQTNYDYGQVGPVSDANTSVQCTKPTTVTSAYKQGVRLKVGASTPTNSIHCYVAYDGTNYNLRIDTEVAGTLTNRASTVIGTTVASPFYVRGTIVGNVVTAQYLTAATTTATAPTATTTATYTVNATDGTLALFGAQASQGYPGLVWVPVDSGSTVKTFNSYFTSVVGGRLAAVQPQMIQGTATARLLTSGNSTPSSVLRFRSVFEMPDWHQYGYTTVGLLNNGQSITDPLALARMHAIRWNYITPPAAAAISLTGSPFTYTNQDGYDEDVAIFGGTVSSVTVTRAAGTAAQVASASGCSVRLAPGDAVTVTYSSAPTMQKLPVS